MPLIRKLRHLDKYLRLARKHQITRPMIQLTMFLIMHVIVRPKPMPALMRSPLKSLKNAKTSVALPGL